MSKNQHVPNSRNDGANRQQSGSGSGKPAPTGTDRVRQQVPSRVNDVLNKR